MKRLIIAVIFAAVLVAPGAAASHWLLYTNGVDNSAARTLEDDGAVMRSGGDEVVGRANRVVMPGNAPGDGSLFLDARVSTSVAGSMVYGDAVTELVFARGDVILAGTRDIAAWYGFWSDINNDHVIDDIRAGACGGPCPEDEFLWHGLADQASVAMVTVVAPRGTVLPQESPIAVAATNSPWVTAPGDAGNYRTYPMTDHTAIDDAHQGWFGAGESAVDGALIATIQTLVVAGAPKSTGTGIGYDLNDPRALYDVDTYAGISPDVESLWVSTSRGAYTQVGAGLVAAATLFPTASGVLSTIVDVVGSIEIPDISPGDTSAVDDVLRAVFDIEGGTNTFSMKEPTDARDDHEGRATWGGHPFNGAYNTYAGHAESHHLWFDAVMYHDVCAGAYADAGVTTVAEPLGCWDITIAEPWAADADPAGRETTFISLTFASSTHLWYDANGDGYFNNACDATDPEEFDSERNLCYSPEIPEFRDFEEIIGVCDVSTAKGGSFTLTPVGGAWPGVIVVRDAEQTTRVLTDDHWEIRDDTAPIELRWATKCTGDFNTFGAAHLVGRDQIIFPNVFPDIGVLVRSEAVIDGFADVSLGIQVGQERVVDYDYYPPAL